MAVIRTSTGEKPKRGELYYVYPQMAWDNDDFEKGTSRTDVKSGRPAIIIGNDAGNGASDMCVIAWLTRQDKAPLPEHVTVPSGPAKESTMLLEHPITVSQSRLGEKISTCSTPLMKKVDSALLVSIGICDTLQDAEYLLKCRAMVYDLQAQVDTYKHELEQKDAEIKALNDKLESHDTNIRDLSNRLECAESRTPINPSDLKLELVLNERDYLRDLVKLSMTGGII